MNAIRLCVVAVALLAAPACRQHRYFVNMDRAMTESEDGKRAAADYTRAFESARRQFAEADAAAKKAEEGKEPDAAAKRQRATEISQRLQRQVDEMRETSRLRLIAAVVQQLPRVAADHHVEVIELSSSVAFIDQGCDVTAEVVRRVNAASKASEVEALKAENERLRAKGKP